MDVKNETNLHMTPIINMFEEEKSLTCIKEKINVAYTIYTLMLKS